MPSPRAGACAGRGPGAPTRARLRCVSSAPCARAASYLSSPSASRRLPSIAAQCCVLGRHAHDADLGSGALGGGEQPHRVLVGAEPRRHLGERVQAAWHVGRVAALDADVEVGERVLLGVRPVAARGGEAAEGEAGRVSQEAMAESLAARPRLERGGLGAGVRQQAARLGEQRRAPRSLWWRRVPRSAPPAPRAGREPARGGRLRARRRRAPSAALARDCRHRASGCVPAAPAGARAAARARPARHRRAPRKHPRLPRRPARRCPPPPLAPARAPLVPRQCDRRCVPAGRRTASAGRPEGGRQAARPARPPPRWRGWPGRVRPGTGRREPSPV